MHTYIGRRRRRAAPTIVTVFTAALLAPAAAGRVIYVKWDATGANNGTSWAHAHVFLQDALAASVSGDEIWVARGVYTPDRGTGRTPGDRWASFRLANGVDWYGGFRGDESQGAERDWCINRTVLSGDLRGDDSAGFINYGENSYHVVRGDVWTLDTPIVDGFTISGGNANSSVPYQYNGGGLWLVNAAVQIRNCSIVGNLAGNRGGGMYADDGADPTLINCLIAGNRANWAQGGIYATYYSVLTLRNCTLAQNTAGNHNGGLAIGNHGTGDLANVIVWGNTEPQFAPINPLVQLTVRYSDVQGGWTGVGNIDAPPLFRDPDGADNVAGTLDDDYALQPASPAVDAGDNDAVPPGIGLDLGGAARFVDVLTCPDTGVGKKPIVDMGAYELWFEPQPGDLNCDGLVDFFDIDGFIQALFDPPGYKLAFPACDIRLGDVNADGRVDNFDIDPFVAALFE